MSMVISFLIPVMKFVYRISNLCVLFVCMLNSYSKLETAKINSAQLHKLQNTTTTVRYNCYKWKEIAINVKHHGHLHLT